MDQLERWERWPVAALFVAQGLQVARWYLTGFAPPEVTAALPWLMTGGALAAMVAIDGAMIATVAGMRQGRRTWWSSAAIVVTAAFGALVALDLHGAVRGAGAWLHAGFAATIACYLLHLAQPRRSVAHAPAPLSPTAPPDPPLLTEETVIVGERRISVRQIARLTGAAESTLRRRLATIADGGEA